jgi:peptidoglycan hydrolase CwlO-like protein
MDVVIRQLERDKADLQRKLAQLETGQLTTGEKRGLNSPMIDTTAEEIEDARRKIAELEAILARRTDA